MSSPHSLVISFNVSRDLINQPEVLLIICLIVNHRNLKILIFLSNPFHLDLAIERLNFESFVDFAKLFECQSEGYHIDILAYRF